MTELKRWIRSAYVPWVAAWEEEPHSRKPAIVASCFGHQIVAEALGGCVAPNPRGKYVCEAEEI
jgi:GMP synthase-like glutamine amidotransferase